MQRPGVANGECTEMPASALGNNNERCMIKSLHPEPAPKNYAEGFGKD